jgi:hypothetical protein
MRVGDLRSLGKAAPDVLLTLVGAFGAACQAQQSVDTQVVHIGVQLRQLTGDPIDGLTSKDFWVSSGPKRFPVVVSRPPLRHDPPPDSLPTSMLIIPSPRIVQGARDPVLDAIEKLRTVWRLNWQVSLLTPEGRLTPYEGSETELRQSVQNPFYEKQTYQNAMKELSVRAGRRLVLYLTDGQNKMPKELVVAARELSAQVYEVGGDVYQNYSFGEGQWSSDGGLPVYGAGLYGPSPAPVGGMSIVDNVETWSASATPAIGKVHGERSLSGAIRDATRDAHNYYDLTVQAPVGIRALVLGVGLRTEYRISAQAHTTGPDSSPTLVLYLPKRQ